MSEIQVTTVEGQKNHQNLEGVARFAFGTMMQHIVSGKNECVFGKNVLGANYVPGAHSKDVTRDADDTVVHWHGGPTLLVRSGVVVPDDTILCDYEVGVRAHADAILETEILRKLDDAMLKEIPIEVEELLGLYCTVFASVVGGIQASDENFYYKGQESVRFLLENRLHELPPEMRFEIFKTLICGHHKIPKHLLRLLKWDEEGVDTMLMGIGTGHARSLLDVDYTKATQEEMDQAVGAALPKSDRGLHAPHVPEG